MEPKAYNTNKQNWSNGAKQFAATIKHQKMRTHGKCVFLQREIPHQNATALHAFVEMPIWISWMPLKAVQGAKMSSGGVTGAARRVWCYKNERTTNNTNKTKAGVTYVELKTRRCNKKAARARNKTVAASQDTPVTARQKARIKQWRAAKHPE